MLIKNNFYLVGIKGVAMTALACALNDLGKNIAGSDVEEDFVTKKVLDSLHLLVESGFTHSLPEETEVVIFSGANGGSQNPQVLEAKKKGLLVLSQARAQAELFNQKQGVAVCGVGGKSSVSAMLAYIWEKSTPQSYLVGVGEIVGLDKTGQFLPASPYFFAEADEYVEDPATLDPRHIIPRFSFLKPQIIIANSLRFDHPDAYRDFEHTKEVFLNFFRQLPSTGALVYNADDVNLTLLAQTLIKEKPALKLLSFGESKVSDFRLLDYQLPADQDQAVVTIKTPTKEHFTFNLSLPGQFNALNALATLVASSILGMTEADFGQLITGYRSVARRLEFKGVRHGLLCYDDYAHHPEEVAAVIKALKTWHPDKKIITAFQSHTFSRTKKLFPSFVQAFALADEVLMIDIFPSAREAFDQTINSTMLCQAIEETFPGKKALNVGTISALKEVLAQIQTNDVFVTIGAGNIYQVYD